MPRRFPIIQLPNRSLIIAISAAALARASDGRARRSAALLARMATLLWAAQEVFNGANWFRRLLGLGAGAGAAAGLTRRRRR